MTDDAPITREPQTITAADVGTIPDEIIAAAAEAAAAPEAPAPAAKSEPAPAPAPAPAMSDIDALGLEIIGLKQRLDFAERRNAYRSDLFAWPDGLK